MYSATTMFVLPNNGNSSNSSIVPQEQLNWKLISAEGLADIIYHGKDKVLIIDSRSFLEYNTSHICEAANVCCSKLVKRRLQHDKLSVRELIEASCGSVPDYNCRIITYDQCTTDPAKLSHDCFMTVLMKKLVKVFQSVELLRGGFLEFQATHPSLCENPTASPTSGPTKTTTTSGGTMCKNQKISAPLTCMSQPCMPVANIGPTKVLPHLYLGSQHDALSQDIMQLNDIGYVLNVSTSCPLPAFVTDTHTLRIPVNDNYSDKLLPHFHGAFQFLDKVREANGRVIIHCLAGISRSATLAIAYVMKSLNMSVDDAYRYVKDKRPTISPNFNFMGQLLEYEKQLKKEETTPEMSPESASFKRQCLAELRSPASPTTAMPKLCYRPKVDSCAAQSPTTALANLTFAQAVASLPSSNVAAEPADSSTFPQLPTTSLDSLNFTPCFAKDEAVVRLSGGTKRPRSAHAGLGSCSKDSMSLSLGAPFSTERTSKMDTSSSNVVMRHTPEQRTSRRPTVRPNSIAFSSYPAFELPDLKETAKEHEPSPTTPSTVAPASQPTITTVSSSGFTLETPPRLKSLTPNVTGKPWSTSSRKSPPDHLSIPCRYGPIAAPSSAAVRKSRSMEDIVTTPESEEPASSNDSPATVPTKCINKPIAEIFGAPNKLESDQANMRQSSGSISSSGSHNSLHGSLELIQVS